MLRKHLFYSVFYSVILLVAAQPAAADDAGRCYSETGDSQIASCTRAINSGARNPAINYNNRGNAYHNKRDYDSAIADYSQAIRIDPKYALPYNNRGNSYHAKGDDDRAIADFNEAIRLDSRYFEPYNGRGNSYHSKHDYDSAIADYSEAIRINPKLALPYNNRGNSYHAKGDDDRAMADFSEAIRLDSKYVEPYNGRGNAYYNKRDYDSAIADYSEAIRINPNYALLYNNRGNTYHVTGDDDRAIADYNEAIRLDSKYLEPYNGRGNAYYSKHNYDNAIADYSEAIRINPKYALAYNNRGNAYHVKGDDGRAIADYNEAIRLNPKYLEPYNGRGNAYYSKSEYDNAIADYSDAIRINPKYAVAYNNRGNAYRSKGDNDRAIADLDQAIRLDPEYGHAYANRGITYEKLGDVDKARADFNTVLRLPQRGNGWPQDKARERLAALPSAAASAKNPSVATAVVAAAVPVLNNDHRIALVIGNSAYENVAQLPNPDRDAKLVADALTRTGFESVTLLTDLRKDALVGALRNFAKRAETADWAVVYYAGHGMEVGGVNYLVPTDAKVASDRDIGFEAVPLEQVLNAAERARKLRLVILDACRDNPFANQMKRTLTMASRSVSRGLAAIEPEAGTLVVFAAKDGETALDGDGVDSPFAAAFVRNLQTPGVEVRRLFDYVRDDVMEVTNRRQKPFSYGSISGRQDFYFVAGK
jgi:tetratricopeptide (TPR) repeat protein